MEELLLLKLGETVLKGLNRGRFEQKLLENTKRSLARFGIDDIYASQSTVFAQSSDNSADFDGAFEAAHKIFGFVAVARAAKCAKDISAIAECMTGYLGTRLRGVSTFKVEARRSDKTFPLTSPQICAEMGHFVLEAFPSLKVDVHNPEITVFVEIREHFAYVHTQAEPGAGGIAVGTGGKVALMLSGGIDSPVAGWMMARRGTVIEAVHFWSYPYTSEQAREKTLTLAALMSQWCGRIIVNIVPFTKIQEEIHKNCRDDLFTLIMRRVMMRISERIAVQTGCGALVTGESLGQVASQTLEAIAATDAAASMPVLRPVIGMDKQDIVALARRIGTFETSILPYEDCCTVFTPRHPKTKPKMDMIIAEELKLDIDGLVEDAINGIERVEIRP